jgi:hypothetical protein
LLARAFQSDPAEGLNRARLELQLHQIHQAAQHVVVVLFIPAAIQAAVGILELAQGLGRAAIAGANRLAASARPEVAGAAVGNGAQPAAERAAPARVAERREILHQGHQDFLNQIIHLGGGHS